MSELFQVNASCFRYVVPFFYGGSFEDAFAAIDSQMEPKYKKNKETREKERVGERKVWERKVDSFYRAERDLYDYVRTEFSFESATGKLSPEKMGCEWLYWRSTNAKNSDGISTSDGQKVLELCYSPKPDWMFHVSNLGLYLFRNHIGFVWYEVELPKQLSSEDVVEFQYNFRELNRRKSLFTKKKETEPFLLGKWIAEQLMFLEPVGLEFAAERKCTQPASDEKNWIVPDKALLFTYCSFSENMQADIAERRALAYHLTNGYKNSYHLSEEVSMEMKYPFSDVIWYATQEGAVYLAWPDQENNMFFDKNLASKIKGDYFALYLKVLFQSYSLLYYARKIQKEIMAEVGNDLEGAVDEGITKLFAEINLFLTKSMTTSVSHIHHQSEFYLYLKRQLRIHEDVKSVTSGLNALDSLQREKLQKEESKRDAKVQAGVGMLSVLAIASALTDLYDFIGKFAAGTEDGWHEVFATSIPLFIAEILGAAVVLVIGGYAAWCAWKAWKESRKE